MAKGTPKDVRSTGRRRARAALYREGRVFECGDCGAVPTKLPKDWPPEQRAPAVGRATPSVPKLEANHLNKDLMDNDPSNLEWLCNSCHQKKDRATGKGESTVEDQFGTHGLL